MICLDCTQSQGISANVNARRNTVADWRDFYIQPCLLPRSISRCLRLYTWWAEHTRLTRLAGVDVVHALLGYKTFPNWKKADLQKANHVSAWEWKHTCGEIWQTSVIKYSWHCIKYCQETVPNRTQVAWMEREIFTQFINPLTKQARLLNEPNIFMVT